MKGQRKKLYTIVGVIVIAATKKVKNKFKLDIDKLTHNHHEESPSWC
jgi:hypothetical protein